MAAFVCAILALICFVLALFSVALGSINLVTLGLAFMAAAMVCGHIPTRFHSR